MPFCDKTPNQGQKKESTHGLISFIWAGGSLKGGQSERTW